MFASSLANGLGVLAAFTIEEPGHSNASLARRTGLSRASITRLTFTLTELGLLGFDHDTRQYHLGSGAVSLAYPFLVPMRLRHMSLPLMQGFADRNRTSVSLGMRSGPRMVYVDSCRSFDGMQFRPDAGASLPLLRTAMGRAWFAAQPESERGPAMRAVRRSIPAEWRQYGRALHEGIASCEERGYCVNEGESHADMHAVAVPLQARYLSRVVVLNAGVPTELIRPGSLERVGQRLVALARRIDSEWLHHA